jgi:orotidine-5'-phosphate decarboxylase
MIDLRLSEKEKIARSMVCLPLDGLKSRDDLKARVNELSPVVGLFKLGMGAFTRFGHDSIKVVQDSDADVFLDLKYYDIPATIADAADAACSLGVKIFNVHASGGVEMMKAASSALSKAAGIYGQRPKVIGVTILTSLDEAAYIHTFHPINPVLDAS